MPAAHKGAISFGLVHIPIELHVAIQDATIRFNQVIKTDDNLSRVQHKKVCSSTGREVTPSEIHRGYRYERDRYVLVEDHELEAIKTEKDRNISILLFTSITEIPSHMFNRAYHVVCQKGGEKPYELLRRAMMEEGKVAIGKSVLGQTEQLVAILPTSEGLILQTLFFQENIKAFPKAITRPEPSEAGLKLAKQLVESLEGQFKPNEYKNEYQARVMEMIEKKLAGETSQSFALRPAAGNSAIDLMEALRASLEERKTKPPRVKPRAVGKLGKVS